MPEVHKDIEIKPKLSTAFDEYKKEEERYGSKTMSIDDIVNLAKK